MSEENNVLDEKLEEDIGVEEISQDKKDFLKEALEDQFNKLRIQSMLLGSQTISRVVLNKITQWEAQPGKRTLNDHKRLVKDLKQFCEVGLSKKVNLDGTVSDIEENNDEADNSKLMEETNESNINESDA